MVSKASCLLPLALALGLLACGGDDAEPAGGTGGSGGGAGSGGGSAACQTQPAAARAGCDSAALLEVPADRGERGPWTVGSRLTTLGGFPLEVWYPARVDGASCPATVRYDIREHLPESQQKKIPDSANPFQDCDCYPDLPLDAEHGPYPVIVMVHGTAAFRTLSLDLQTHWASQGFVVLAADHPGIRLKHLLGALTGEPYDVTTDQAGNVRDILAALDAPSGELAFLAGNIDRGRVGLAGHSAGGGAISKLGGEAGVQVLASLSSGGTEAGSSLKSTLVLSGLEDGLVDFQKGAVVGYDASPTAKRLVGVNGAGHSLPTELCLLGADQGGILQIAIDNGVDVPPFIAVLAQDGCAPTNLDAERGLHITRALTTLVFEETLACSSTATTALAQTQSVFPEVSEFREDL